MVTKAKAKKHKRRAKLVSQSRPTLHKARAPESAPAKKPEWSVQEVMTMAGEVMGETFRLAEHGNTQEKRVCKAIVSRANEIVQKTRVQRMIKGFGI